MILLEVDPNVVRPGWGALIVVLLLALAMVLLFLSMRKQFRKIRIEPAANESAEGEKPGQNPAEPTPGSQS